MGQVVEHDKQRQEERERHEPGDPEDRDFDGVRDVAVAQVAEAADDTGPDGRRQPENDGDVLLQVIFHAEMAQENPEAGFGINEVARELADKLVRRHPHVFGTSAVSDAEGVVSQWDAIKRKEHSIEDKPYLQDCGKGLPSLLQTYKITKKVAKVGFDWPDHAGVVEKIREETAEVAETLELPDDDPHVAEELGDLLFVVVNLCRRRKVDPELALFNANRKFERRFNSVEVSLKEQGIGLASATLDEMEAAWQEAKRKERGQ